MSAFERRCDREDEADRLARLLHAEQLESRERIRAAFRDAMLGLIDWQAPAELTPREYGRLEQLPQNPGPDRACARREKVSDE